MICQKCNAELADDALICSVCGEKVALEAQKAKVEEKKENIKGAVSKVFAGPLSIVSGALLCLWALFSIIIVFTKLGANGGVLPFIWALALRTVPIIFAIITAVAALKMFFSKNADADKLGKVSKFMGILRGFAVVHLVFACIVGGLVYIIMVLLGALLGAVSTEIGDFADLVGDSAGGALEGLETIFAIGGFGLIFVASILVFLLIFYFIHMIKMYAANRDYYARVAATVNGEAYDVTKKPPFIRTFVMAGINLCLMIYSLILLGGLFSFAWLLLTAFLVVNGVTYILADNALKASTNEYEQEKSLLAEIEAKTAEVAQPVAPAAAEAAPAAAQAAPAAEAANANSMNQQQMMQMMQMMMNQMNNNNNNNNAN